MTEKTVSKEIKMFIESVDQVLNSNSAYFEYELSSQNFNVTDYIKELFLTGRFCDSFSKAIDTYDWSYPNSIPNIELKLLPIAFPEFREILVDMLAVKKKYFHGSPYRVDIGAKTIQFVIDNFIEAVINSDNSEPYYKNIKELEDKWNFYTMPRHYCSEEQHEIDFLRNEKGQTYRPMSEINNDNFLGEYFYYLGLDSFLVFHNKERIVFLMTNGSD